MPEVAVFLHADAPEAVMRENSWYLMIVADSGLERHSIRIGLCFLCEASQFVSSPDSPIFASSKLSNQFARGWLVLASILVMLGLLLSTSPQSTCWWTPSLQLQGGSAHRYVSIQPCDLWWIWILKKKHECRHRHFGWKKNLSKLGIFWDLNRRGYLPPEAGFVHLAHNYVRHDCPGVPCVKSWGWWNKCLIFIRVRHNGLFSFHL